MKPIVRSHQILASMLENALVDARVSTPIYNTQINKGKCVRGCLKVYYQQYVQRILALVSMDVYGPVVDQLVASSLPIPSWTGFNPALVPNRTPPSRGDTCPGPAVEPDLYRPGRSAFGETPAPVQ